MRNFIIETSLPFPFLELTENVKATEVKKPSGVAYMILALLRGPKNKNQPLGSLLEIFGIPKNLHSIFTNEIKKLITGGIITCNVDGYNPMYFLTYTLDNFNFTDLGNKVFAEEQIATGKEKEKLIKCYYNIALNQLTLKPNLELEVRPLRNSAFNEDFVLKFECRKNVEDFYNAQKGPSFPIKQAEVITSVELQDKKCFVGKYDTKFIIDCDDLKIKFDNNNIQEFFDANYTANIVNKAIELKNKFKLDNAKDVKLSEFNDDDINHSILPNEIAKVISKKYTLVVMKEDYNFNKNSLIIKDESTVLNISKYASFICVDGLQVYAYCPVRLELNTEKSEKIYLPLVLVLKPSLDDLSKAIENYIDSKEEYSYDSFKEIVAICNITKNYSKVTSILKSYMTEHNDTNIVILNEVKPLLTINSQFINDYKTVLSNVYTNYITNINEDSLESALKITSKIPSFIDMKPYDVLKLIMESIKSSKHIIETYETLANYFKEDLILNYINPFEEALNKPNLKAKYLKNISIFDNLLSSLKKITGIKDNKEFVYNEENVIKSEFKKEFIAAKNTYKDIQIFRPHNEEYFNNADSYMMIFEKINDNINLLESALKDPKNITYKLIEDKIVMGDYQFVLINLATKLELLLSEKFNLEGNFSDKLNTARKEKILPKDIVSDLHELRENRNALAHPNDRQSNYNADDLRRWNKEVFDIEEVN